MIKHSNTCAHKWVHLRKTEPYESGYRRWVWDDVFFCEKCLEHKSITNEVPERRSHAF